MAIYWIYFFPDFIRNLICGCYCCTSELIF